jgi:RNA methyltransferase, TrmH family
MKNSDTIITSPDNKKFKEYKALLESAGISKYKKIIASGKKIIMEILAEKLLVAVEVLIYENWVDNDPEFMKIIDSFSKNNALVVLKKSLYNELDTVNTRQPLLVVEAPDWPVWNFHSTSGCTLVLPFQNPVNVGACIRSAAAFGVNRIVVLKDAANPYHPRAIRASAGAVFRYPIYRGPDIKDLLHRHKELTNLITLDMDGQDIQFFSFPQNFILMPGIEGPGLIKKIKHLAVSIGMEKGVESLNAGVAVSIVLYEWKKRLNKSG